MSSLDTIRCNLFSTDHESRSHPGYRGRKGNLGNKKAGRMKESLRRKKQIERNVLLFNIRVRIRE
jgi:hypothetical protein